MLFLDGGGGERFVIVLDGGEAEIIIDDLLRSYVFCNYSTAHRTFQVI